MSRPLNCVCKITSEYFVNLNLNKITWLPLRSTVEEHFIQLEHFFAIFYLPISVDFLELHMVNLDTFLWTNTVFERVPELQIFLPLHDIVMILLVLPSQESIERESTMSIAFENTKIVRLLIRVPHPHPVIFFPNNIFLKTLIVSLEKVCSFPLFDGEMTHLSTRH